MLINDIKFRLLFLLLTLSSSQCLAKGNQSLKSELGHVAGGATLTTGVTLLTEKYWPDKDSVWIGFTVSSLIGTLAEYSEYRSGANHPNEAALDAFSHVMGSALGAYVSNKYLIAPDIRPEPGGTTSLGLNLSFRF